MVSRNTVMDCSMSSRIILSADVMCSTSFRRNWSTWIIASQHPDITVTALISKG